MGAMKKCDEDKAGMALELGLNMFADGNPILSDLVRQLLISAYTRCDRDLFAEILDAHLKDRRKTLVSRLDLTGNITFAQAPVMRGPAYDKSSVGGAKNGQAALTQGEQEAPKWEGTKIVKTATKKYGQFGSGGRRDQLKALEPERQKPQPLKELRKMPAFQSGVQKLAAPRTG